MLYEFIAAIVAGLAIAGIATGLRWLSRGSLPRWMIPAAAGLGMLSYAIWSEYSWFNRLTNTMPPEIAVTWQHEDRSPWRPWSYYKPVIDRFTAIDTRSVQRHQDQPGNVMVDVIIAARWQPSARLKTVYDCNAKRRADLLGEGVAIADDGAIIGAVWADLPVDDPALVVACRGQ